VAVVTVALPVPTVEISFDSDPLSTSPVWTDVSEWVVDEAGVQIDRGRPDEWSHDRAGRAGFRLDNSDRRFDPTFGPASLALDGTGDYATTPDSAAISLTAGFKMVMRVQMPDWTPASERGVFCKNNSSSQRSFSQNLLSTGRLRVQSSTDGSAVTSTDMTVAPPFVNGSTYWTQVTFNPNNGANRVATFEYAPDQDAEPVSWTLMETVIGATTTIFDGTLALAVGAFSTGGSPITGTVHRAILRTLAGVTVADFHPGDAASSSATSWSARATGETWTVAGNPVLTEGSPFHGLLTPNRQVRITCTHDSVTYDKFRGFLAGWPQSFGPSGFRGWVDVEAFDGFGGVLAAARLVDDLYRTEVLSYDPTPVLWLRNFSADGQWIDEAGYVIGDILLGGGAAQPPQVSASALPGLTSQSAQLNGTTWWNNVTTNPQVVPGDEWTIAVAVQVPAGTVSVPLLHYIDSTGTIISQPLYVDANGCPAWRYVNGANTDSATCSVVVADGRWHLVAITGAPGNDLRWYVDGQPAATSVVNTTGFPPGVIFDRIAGNGDVGVAPTVRWSGGVQDLLVLDVTLTAAQVAVLYGLGVGERVEDAATRVGRLLDEAGWPAGWRDITNTPRATVGQLTFSGQEALTAIQEVERSEQGRVFIAGGGDVTFLSRYAVQEVARCSTSQAKISDDGAGDVTASSFGFRPVDDLWTQNDVTVQTPTGQSRSQDTASITLYGRRSATIPTILSDVAAAAAMSAGLVYQRKTPATRIEPFTVDLLNVADDTSMSRLLGLELHDRVTVEMTPVTVGAQLVLEQTIDNIRWDIRQEQWRLLLGTSPVRPRFFQLDVDVLDGPVPLGY